MAAKTRSESESENVSPFEKVIALQAAVRGFLVRRRIKEAVTLYQDIVEEIEGRDAARELQWTSHLGISLPMHELKEPEMVMLYRRLTQRTTNPKTAEADMSSPPHNDTDARISSPSFSEISSVDSAVPGSDNRARITTTVPGLPEAGALEYLTLHEEEKDITNSRIRSQEDAVNLSEATSPVSTETNSREMEIQDGGSGAGDPGPSVTGNKILMGDGASCQKGPMNTGSVVTCDEDSPAPEGHREMSSNSSHNRIQDERTKMWERRGSEEVIVRGSQTPSPIDPVHEMPPASKRAVFLEAEIDDCGHSPDDVVGEMNSSPEKLVLTTTETGNQELQKDGQHYVYRIEVAESGPVGSQESGPETTAMEKHDEDVIDVHSCNQEGGRERGTLGQDLGRHEDEHLEVLQSNIPQKDGRLIKSKGYGAGNTEEMSSARGGIVGSHVSRPATDKRSDTDERGDISAGRMVSPPSVSVSRHAAPGYARQGHQTTECAAANRRSEKRVIDITSPPSPIPHHGCVYEQSSTSLNSRGSEQIPVKSPGSQETEAGFDDAEFGDITKVTALSSWDETSLWGPEDGGSVLDVTAHPHSMEQLQTIRKNTAMELLWVQQAIESRKTYLRLKANFKG